ncbi:uncharacterized protein LOC8066897 isoform X2 [Sorghum bicolor]|uniref:uncharacterized protein LOC8066897 isoform X2 n=1 Tax=Sorghum bicolor TaxID=4558 RepID=UPI000B423D79|nr:uncharacterized protein LOC8066897 isoform X2 [Sorghum bicolor]|eukprot:XP_021304760.1 uncharacterized protein LOC8066897 isoform X2 [Sorghum bicolor]
MRSEGDIEAPKIQEESDGNGIVASVAFPTIKEVTRESRALNSDSNCIVTTVAFPTIKKITRESRALNSGRYEPCHVWIGPYYDPRDSSSSSSQLRSRMDDGREYLQLLIIVAANKPPAEGRTNDLENALVMEISKQLDAASPGHYDYTEKSCWTGDREDLARMLLFDGCYLLTEYVSAKTLQQQYQSAHAPPGSSKGQGQGRMRQGEGSSSSGSDDNKDASNALVVRDTWYILQNQIPFLVLEEIFKQVTGCATAEYARRDIISRAHLLLDKHRMCISPSHPAASKLLVVDDPPQNQTTAAIFHLLHLLHKLLKPHNKKPPAGSGSGSGSSEPESEMRKSDRRAQGQWHRATDYRMYANVEFKGRDLGDDDDDSDADADAVLSVLDVRIKGRNVIIPCLRIDGDTWTILLNLMALEGQHPRLLGTYVTAYCLFMSQIACTKEDVELLEAKGVIDRHLSTPESVAADFSRLCDAVVLDRSNSKSNYLKPIWQHLDKRYTSRKHNVLSWIRLNYLTCRNISVLLGVFSAIILLGAGLLSAVYQVLSYYHPQNVAPAPHHMGTN